jgi:hypothetical protein
VTQTIDTDLDAPTRLAPTPAPSEVALARGREPARFFLELARRYGDVVMYAEGPRPSFLLSHPDAVRHVLVTRADRYEDAAREDEAPTGHGDLQALLGNRDERTVHATLRTLRLLAAHPDERRRVRAEVDVVLRGRAPRRADLASLGFTRMAVDEALRLDPPVRTVGRRALIDDEVLGVRIPAGSEVTLSPYVVQRHPAFWPEPEVFDPERFAAGEPRDAYFPFGALGGAEAAEATIDAATLELAALVQRFEVDLGPDGALRATPRGPSAPGTAAC